MDNTTTLTLIDGTFLPDDAREILMNVFASKLTFHRLKNLSSNERYGIEDEIAQKRIPELTLQMEKLQQLLMEAKAINATLQISSAIHISLSSNRP